MATYRYVAYSVIQAIKEWKDDSEVKRNTVIFWAQIVANRLIQQRLGKRKIQSGEYLSKVGGIQIQVDGRRKFVTLPSDIVDLENDNGIEQVTYHLEDFDYCDSPMDVPFEKTSPAKIWSLKAIGIRTPKPMAPKMARENSNLYLYGIEQVNVSTVDMWIYAAIEPVHLVNLDSEIPISEDQVEVLINRVMGLARFAMLFPDDKTNLGGDLNSTLGKNKTAISQVPIGDQQNQQQQQGQQDYE